MVKVRNRPTSKNVKTIQCDGIQNKPTTPAKNIKVRKTPSAPIKSSRNSKITTNKWLVNNFELNRRRAIKKMLFNRLWDKKKEHFEDMIRQQRYLNPPKKMAFNDLIQKYSNISSIIGDERIQEKNGNTFIKPTIRLDGTIRKARKVKPNYTPLDEIEAEKILLKQLAFVHWCSPKNVKDI